MFAILNFKYPLQNILVSSNDTLLRKFLLGLTGIFILTIASQLSVPLTPVPLTFQSATVILIGMAYGARYGTYIILSYLAAGICGLPVFADFSTGPHVLVGPTGGYLLGFIPAAFISGLLASKGFAKNARLSFIAACIGTAAIFGCGLLQLSTFISWQAAVAAGLIPFIFSEAIKLIAVACMVPKLWKNI